MGRIGQAVARRARAFGLQIHYHNRRRVAPKIEEELQATYWESLDQMLARMDIISINCPHTPATYHLLSARRLKLIRPQAYVVNTARGEVIDENALIRMIDGGRDRRRRPRRVRARAGGQSEARPAGARRQGRAAAAHGLGHDRRPHRHGREGDRQYPARSWTATSRRTACCRRCCSISMGADLARRFRAHAGPAYVHNVLQKSDAGQGPLLRRRHFIAMLGSAAAGWPTIAGRSSRK